MIGDPPGSERRSERRRGVGRPRKASRDLTIFKKHPLLVEAGAAPSLRSMDEKVRTEAQVKSDAQRDMFVTLGDSFLQDCQTEWGRFDKCTRDHGIPPEATLANFNRFLQHQAHHPDGVVQKCKGLQVSS